MLPLLVTFTLCMHGLACWCVAIGPQGLRKLRPHVELQSRMGQAEKLGYGAETKRQVG